MDLIGIIVITIFIIGGIIDLASGFGALFYLMKFLKKKMK